MTRNSLFKIHPQFKTIFQKIFGIAIPQAPYGFRSKAVHALFVLVLLLGIIARSYDLAGFQHIENDERSFVMSGISLLRYGFPESWTIYWEKYPQIFFTEVAGERHSVVRPYLDHPPVFQVLSGGWTLLVGGVSDMGYDWGSIRLLSIVITTLTTILLFLVVRLYGGNRMGWLSFLALLLLPSHVLASRLLVAEHLLVLLLLIVMLGCFYLEGSSEKLTYWKRKMWLFALVFICISAPLVKLSGLLVPAAASLLLFQLRAYRLGVVLASCGVIALVFFSLYGWWFDWELFTLIQSAHGLREQSWWHFFSIFQLPDLGYFFLHDPYWVLGVLGSFLVVHEAYGGDSSESSPGLSVLLKAFWAAQAPLLLAVAPLEAYGWYRFTLFPVLAIGVGYLWQVGMSGKFIPLMLQVAAVAVVAQQLNGLALGGGFVGKLLLMSLFVPVVVVGLFPRLVPQRTQQLYSWFILALQILLLVFWNLQLLSMHTQSA